MRLILSAAAAASICSLPSHAQTKPAAQAPNAAGTCAVLMKSYNGASVTLADNFASSVGDNSAPRATLREMEAANALSVAKIALDLMRDNRCTLPKIAPSASLYMSQALACRSALLKATGAETPGVCKRET